MKEALAATEAIANAPGGMVPVPAGLASDATDRINLVLVRADLMRANGENAGALKLMQAYVSNYGEADLGWEGWFMLAGLYDSNEQWSQAEAAAIKARKLGGDRADILNFIGYGWIDHRQHISEGLELVRQALKAEPKSGAITDSLGWAYYQLGQFNEACDWLEKAILLEPANAEITDHLGDVYMALQRRDEARFEWSRALDLSSSERLASALKAKIDKAGGTLRQKQAAARP